MKTVSFPNTWDRKEGYYFPDKNAASRIYRGRDARHGACYGRDDLLDDRCRDAVCVGSFQEGLVEHPYSVSPFSF
jgi:hypothetical protein